MTQPGFFDWQFRYEKLDATGDPLVQLNKVIKWERFRSRLEEIREKDRKSNAGAKPYDVVMMFKVLIIQSLYNLSDEAVEYQILDRMSFMRFLGLNLGDPVPDAKTIWLFREQLTQAGSIARLFKQFEGYMRESGFAAKRGQIIDASIVSIPKQRNSREENEIIKNGQTPEKWTDTKKRQKDVDARWTKKNSKSYFGYKNHIGVDVKHKLIRAYQVTSANLHDSQVFEELLSANTSRDLWADSAYRSADRLDWLAEHQYREQVQRKGTRNHPLSSWERQGNRTRSRIRSRVEHIFGVQAQRAGSLILRSIGLVRARAKIGLRNLAYNLDRYGTLLRA